MGDAHDLKFTLSQHHSIVASLQQFRDGKVAKPSGRMSWTAGRIGAGRRQPAKPSAGVPNLARDKANLLTLTAALLGRPQV